MEAGIACFIVTVLRSKDATIREKKAHRFLPYVYLSNFYECVFFARLTGVSIAVYQTPGSPLRTRRHASLALSMSSVPGPTSSARGGPSVPPILPINGSSEGHSPLSDEDNNSDPVLHVEPALNFPLPAEEFKVAVQLDDSDGAHNDIDSSSEPAIPPSPITSPSSSDSFALLDFFSEGEKKTLTTRWNLGGQDSDQVPGQGPPKCEFHPILNGTSELSIAN